MADGREKASPLDLADVLDAIAKQPAVPLRDIRGELRSAAQMLREMAQAAEWRPIESAPLDGARVLLWMEPDGEQYGEPVEPCAVKGYYVVWSQRMKERHGMRDGWSWYGPARCHPTHWRPLPAGPEAQP